MSFKNCKINGVGINSNDYHNQKGERGRPDFVMSPSSLKSGDACWRRWVDGYESPSSEAKDWGNLVDALLLTPEQFLSRYAIRPQTYPADGKKGEQPTEKPWNGNSNWCKAWIQKQGGKEVVSADELAQAKIAVTRLMGDETISAFINASNKQVHIVGEWHDERAKIVIPVECLIDLLPRSDTEFYKSVGDFKSATSGAVIPFSKVAAKFGYHVQAAFDLAMIVAAENREPDYERNTWSLIGQESYPPFQTFKRMYDATVEDGLIAFGKNAYESALHRYAQCLKTGKWYDYDDDPKNSPDRNVSQGWTIMRPASWMAYESLSMKLEADAAEALEENEDITP